MSNRVGVITGYIEVCERETERAVCVTRSVTRLGDFWKFLATDFLSKVAQMAADFWSSF